MTLPTARNTTDDAHDAEHLKETHAPCPGRCKTVPGCQFPASLSLKSVSHLVAMSCARKATVRQSTRMKSLWAWHCVYLLTRKYRLCFVKRCIILATVANIPENESAPLRRSHE